MPNYIYLIPFYLKSVYFFSKYKNYYYYNPKIYKISYNYQNKYKNTFNNKCEQCNKFSYNKICFKCFKN